MRPTPVIEISEPTEATAANAMFMHDAAASWDGSDPIRISRVVYSALTGAP